MMRTTAIRLLLVSVLVLLGGCGLLGQGQDASKVYVDHRCEVEIDQNAKVQDLDQSGVIEEISVLPDCTTNITFRQQVGITFHEELSTESGEKSDTKVRMNYGGELPSEETQTETQGETPQEGTEATPDIEGETEK